LAICITKERGLALTTLKLGIGLKKPSLMGAFLRTTAWVFSGSSD